MKNQDGFFFCYSKRVSDFLRSEGVYFITVAKDMKTDKIFSLFTITPELDEALKKYKNR